MDKNAEIQSSQILNLCFKSMFLNFIFMKIKFSYTKLLNVGSTWPSVEPNEKKLFNKMKKENYLFIYWLNKI